MSRATQSVRAMTRPLWLAPVCGGAIVVHRSYVRRILARASLCAGGAGPCAVTGAIHAGLMACRGSRPRATQNTPSDTPMGAVHGYRQGTRYKTNMLVAGPACWGTQSPQAIADGVAGRRFSCMPVCVRGSKFFPPGQPNIKPRRKSINVSELLIDPQAHQQSSLRPSFPRPLRNPVSRSA